MLEPFVLIEGTAALFAIAAVVFGVWFLGFLVYVIALFIE